MIFIDTNYFLRFFLADVNKEYLEAKKLFLEASDGNYRLFTSSIVVFEIYWVLLAQFNKDKFKVIEVLKKMFRFKFIDFEDLNFFEEAIKIYEDSNIGLVDSYNLVYAKSQKTQDFKTFDKKLQNRWKTQK